MSRRLPSPIASRSPGRPAWVPGLRVELALLLLLAACGAPAPARATDDPAEEEDPTIALQRRIDALAQEVQSLTGERDLLRAKLDLADQRLGHAPYRPRAFRPLDVSDRGLEIGGDAFYVAGPGERPTKRNLSKHLQNSDVTVFSFWATWCVPCTSEAELAHLRLLQKRLARHRVELVSLAVDDLAKVQGHERADRWLYPLWQRSDAHLKMLPRGLMQSVGVGLPLFLVVRDGEVRYFRSEALDDASVGEMVTAALDARAR